MISGEPQCSLGQLTTIFKIANYIFYIILDTSLFSYGISILFAAPPHLRGGGMPQYCLKKICLHYTEN